MLAGNIVFPTPAAPLPNPAKMGIRIESLSSAQRRALAALGEQLNKQIAGDLNVAEATEKARPTAIFRTLGVHNRLQAILAVKPLLVLEAEG